MSPLWLVGCAAMLLCCTAQGVPDKQEEKEQMHARQAWILAEKGLKSVTNKILRKAVPSLMKEIYRKDLSTTCLSALLSFSNALKQSKAWAFKMLDSCGRFPEGFLAGTLTSLGNYQECAQIRVNETKLKLKGQYCTIIVNLPLPEWKPFTSMHGTVPELYNISAPDSVITHLMTLLHNLHVTSAKIGICTPSLCTLDDIERLVQIIPEKLGLDWTLAVKQCDVQEPVHFTHAQLFVLYVMGAVILAASVGSIVDIVWSSEQMEEKSLKATLFHVARAFSFPANARKLSEYIFPEEALRFVYGLVFIVFYWVSISNTFMYVNYDVTSNFVKAFEIVQQVFYEVVLNRVMPLQVLFFISGLMTTYRWLKSPEQKLSVVKFLLKRYWRFTPAYALVLALMVLTPTWGSGPSWHSHMDPLYNNCRDHWWYNLLYINNYIDSDKVCLDHTWVFAVDAQLHVLAVFILIPLKMRPKIGLMVTFVLSVASLASVALTNVYYDLPPNEALAFLHTKDRNFYAEHSYYRVYSHVATYCSGVLVAYLMHHNPNLKISKKTSCFLWVFTSVGLWAALCSVHSWRSGLMPSPTVGALYSALSKVAQAAFLAWLSVACMTGNAGGVKDVLAWRPFAFLSRLMFIAYLTHVPIITMVTSFKRAHMFVTDLELFYVVLNHVSGTFIVSYLLHVYFEAPFLSLTDIVRRCHKRKTLPSVSEKPPLQEKTPAVTTKTWTKTEKSNC